MSSIAIITDTDASLPAEAAAGYGIRQVPITVHFGQETFETGVDIDGARLFARVDGEGKPPTTSALAPSKFAEAYQAAFDAGAEAVICFCVSGEVSATYSAAVNPVTDHPGAPATAVVNDILELTSPDEVQVEWTNNEKVAIEMAFGASLGGMRSLLCVKSVGLNFALDPLMALNLSGCNAGLVVLVSDDPVAGVRKTSRIAGRWHGAGG